MPLPLVYYVRVASRSRYFACFLYFLPMSRMLSRRYTNTESSEWLAQRLVKLEISSYEEFANLVGLDRGTISRYFRHDRRPSIDVIAPLCEVLEVSPETLLIVLGALDKR
ncbi:MAG: XRE family transcriptional regulator [Candidatus Planktophila sp.]|nr:XRE family transcriptional regulator [Candidatus Planktophila sp.]MSO24749.1 XRE family transcriptional regulator [Candidatus Planktophila sp.]PHX69983.1 MAG: hypothetical protein CK523_01590 [Actinomycetota bacterium]